MVVDYFRMRKYLLRKYLFSDMTVMLTVVIILFILFTLFFKEALNFLIHIIELIFIFLMVALSIKILQYKDKKCFYKNSIDEKIKNPFLPLKKNEEISRAVRTSIEKLREEILGNLGRKDINNTTILIEGMWGAGKSTLLYSIKSEIEKRYKNEYDIIFLDLIGFSTSGDILKTLLRELSIKYGYPYWKDVVELYERTSVSTGILSFDFVLENNLEFNRKINDFKWWIYQSLERDNKKLLIILDEMDRLIDRATILSIIKFINIFSRIPGVFLIATLDKRALLDIFEKEYLVKGYLDKTFDFVFEIKPSRSILNNYFYSELTKWL